MSFTVLCIFYMEIMWNSSWMADWLTTLSYVTPHYLIRSIYTNIFMILCNFSEMLSHVSRTSQCNLAEATALCMWLVLHNQFGFVSLLTGFWTLEPNLPHLPTVTQVSFSLFTFLCWRFSFQAPHSRCTRSASATRQGHGRAGRCHYSDCTRRFLCRARIVR